MNDVPTLFTFLIVQLALTAFLNSIRESGMDECHRSNPTASNIVYCMKYEANK